MTQGKARRDLCCDPPETSTFSGELPDDLAALAKAISHPARVRILIRLIEEGTCITGDLADELPLAPSTVSEHLRVLRESGLIQGTVDGPRRCYCINPEALGYFRRLVTTLCPEAKA
jgi:ArsR family transcriptional regulator